MKGFVFLDMIQKKPTRSLITSVSISALFLAIFINTFSGQINDFVMVKYLESEFGVHSEGFGLMITVFLLEKPLAYTYLESGATKLEEDGFLSSYFFYTSLDPCLLRYLPH
jgi:hypothetical protein